MIPAALLLLALIGMSRRGSRAEVTRVARDMDRERLKMPPERASKWKPSPSPIERVKTAVRRQKLKTAIRKRLEKKRIQVVRNPPPIAFVHPSEAKPSPERAAVDAAMRTIVAPKQPPLPLPPKFFKPSAPPSAAKAAAADLLRFLIKTGRFGNKRDRPEEIKRAQRALGVKPDGIVGPKTRAAAAKAGVALPPRK